jgi:hypothetical protein
MKYKLAVMSMVGGELGEGLGLGLGLGLVGGEMGENLHAGLLAGSLMAAAAGLLNLNGRLKYQRPVPWYLHNS